MKAHLLRRACLWLLVVAFPVVVISLAVQRNYDIKAVEDALDRDWEIVFNNPLPPATLPRNIDAAAWEWLSRRYAATAGYDGTQPPKTRNRADVYHERFHCFFRGPIRSINIGYPEQFRGDALGAALARFPRLRSFSIDEDKTPIAESEWAQLCRRLRALPQLEELYLHGPTLTETALAPLAGHPHLSTITIEEGRFTPACSRLFATMPQLKTLSLFPTYDGDTWLTAEEAAALRTALPGVKVNVP